MYGDLAQYANPVSANPVCFSRLNSRTQAAYSYLGTHKVHSSAHLEHPRKVNGVPPTTAPVELRATCPSTSLLGRKCRGRAGRLIPICLAFAPLAPRLPHPHLPHPHRLHIFIGFTFEQRVRNASSIALATPLTRQFPLLTHWGQRHCP